MAEEFQTQFTCMPAGTLQEGLLNMSFTRNYTELAKFPA